MSSLSTFALCFLFAVQHSQSATVNCNGDCSCPIGTIDGRGDETCELSCNRPDICKARTLTCSEGDACLVNCDAKSACMSGTIVDGSKATHLTVICNVEDSCKDGIDIRCGTGDCVLECNGKASCENFGTVDVRGAQSFVCLGNNCPEAGAGLPVAFSPSPTTSPTNPTMDPTTDPTIEPTNDPTTDPSAAPTLAPTSAPSLAPTYSPSAAPSHAPSLAPSLAPSFSPSAAPSYSPSAAPSGTPSAPPTNAPTGAPSIAPTGAPSRAPTGMPTEPTLQPTRDPTKDPTSDPTAEPTSDPTKDPTIDPTLDPTSDPTMEPTMPTSNPTKGPTRSPTFRPTGIPIDQVQSAFLLDGSTTTMELSIAVTVLALGVCFVCSAIGCLFYARFKLKHHTTRRGTFEERQSVMTSPVNHEYGMETIEMAENGQGPVRPETTQPEQWEIEVPEADEETGRIAKISQRSQRGPKSQRYQKGKLIKPKPVKGLKGKKKRRRRPKYEKVDSNQVDDPVIRDGAHERNAFDFGSQDRLQIVDAPSSQLTVSPPSTTSMMVKDIPAEAVQPAFYMPGMNLTSPPIPPQPHVERMRSIPKQKSNEDLGVSSGPTYIASPTMTALSDVTVSTKMGHGSDDEEETLVTRD